MTSKYSTVQYSTIQSYLFRVMYDECSDSSCWWWPGITILLVPPPGPFMFPCPVMYIINLTLTCHLEARPVLTIIMTQDVFRFHSTTLQWRKSYSVRLNYPLYCSVQLQLEEIYLFVLWTTLSQIFKYLLFRIYLFVNNPIRNFQISNSTVCSHKSNLIIKLKASKNDKSLLIEKKL